MRRIVLPVEDRGIGDGRGEGGAGATAGSVTLVLPETRSEYEKARAEVESLARAARGSEVTGPADGGRDGMDGTYAMPGAGRWVVTIGKQRRAWDLPDLGGVATVPAFTHADLQRAWRRDTVPLVDADDAVRLLAGNDAGSRADNETGGVGGTRVSGSVRSEHAAAEFVNLKHGRGPIPAHVRETFDELSGRLRIDALVSARTATTSSPGSSGSCPSAALGSSSASSSRRSWPGCSNALNDRSTGALAGRGGSKTRGARLSAAIQGRSLARSWRFY